MPRKILLSLLLLVACSGPHGALDGVSADGIETLFSKVDRGVAFMGVSATGALSCDAHQMDQGYVFRRDDKANRVWIDSLRPTSVVSHNINAVVEDGARYSIEAVNGTGNHFTLSVTMQGDDTAMISFDGAPAEMFKRCVMIEGA